ncbi:MAG: putative Ig domain-containing protein, partial [Kiloniellales bacterium]|nr:putative Ig domain-containing protein [Kiloniellales bacterium]
GDGDDLLIAGGGADSIDGGAGSDAVSFAHSATPVEASLLTGQAKDGTGVEVALSNLETLIGSSGDDVLTGNEVDNLLAGGEGSDRLRAGAGNDRIDGGDGYDVAVYNDDLSEYSISFDPSLKVWTIDHVNGVGIASDGVDTLVGVEEAVFSDNVVRLNNSPVVATSIASQTAYEGQAYALDLPENAFTDPDLDDELSYSVALSNGLSLPNWLTFDGESLYGRPGDGDADQIRVRITATDSRGESTGQDFDLTVEPLSMTLDSATILEDASGGAMVGTVSASDPLEPGVSFAYRMVDDAGGRFVIDPQLGTLSLAETATLDYDTAASHEVVVATVDSGVRYSTRTFSVQVTDVLRGSDGNDTLEGGAGDDILGGGSGDDLLIGSAGDDVYRFGRGDGLDTVDNVAADAGTTDTLSFKHGIAHDQLWFTQSGNDLKVQIVGEQDAVLVQDWYGAPSNRLDQFETAGGLFLYEADVQQLVNAMAAFSPPSGSEQDLPQPILDQLQPTLAATWTSGS